MSPGQRSIKWQQVAPPTMRSNLMPLSYNEMTFFLFFSFFFFYRFRPLVWQESRHQKVTFNKRWFLLYALYFELYIFLKWKHKHFFLRTTRKHLSNCALERERERERLTYQLYRARYNDYFLPLKRVLSVGWFLCQMSPFSMSNVKKWMPT